MRTKTQVKADAVKVGDWLFVGPVCSQVIKFTAPHEVFKFPARTAVTGKGSLTLIDGDTCEIAQWVIDGMVYADKDSHDAALAEQTNAMNIQHKWQNAGHF